MKDWMIITVIFMWVLLPIIAYIDMRAFEIPQIRKIVAKQIIDPTDKKDVYTAYLRKNLTEVIVYSGAVILSRWFYLKCYKKELRLVKSKTLKTIFHD